VKKTYIRVVASVVPALVLLLGMTSFADAKGPAQYSVGVTQVAGVNTHAGHTHLRININWSGYYTNAYYWAVYEWDEASSSWVFRYERTSSIATPSDTGSAIFDYAEVNDDHNVKQGEQWKVVTTLLDKKGTPAKKFIHKGTVEYTVQ